jgi:hypothetical protein
VATALPDDLSTGLLAGSWMLLYLPFALLLLLVPSGHARSRGWAAAGWALTAVVVAFFAVCAAQALSPAAGEPLAIAGVSLLPLFLNGQLECAAAPVAGCSSEVRRCP